MLNQFIMIQRALLFTVFCFSFLSGLEAQTCTPAQPFPDSLIALPPSWSLTRLDAGIQDTACIGQYYEFTLSLKAPGSIPGLPGITVLSIAIPAQNGVANIPQGMSYVCNPPNCVFPRDSLTCIKIFGTPTDPNDVGQKDLTLSLTINSNIGVIPNIAYPNPTLDPGGHYYLHVKPQGSSGCFIPNSTNETTRTVVDLTSAPNPTTGFTQIFLQSLQAGTFDFLVSDLTGKPVHRERVQIFTGENIIHFDGSFLPTGMYLYSFSNGAEVVTRKMVLNK